MTDKQKQEITEVERLTIESASWKHAAQHLEAERDAIRDAILAKIENDDDL